jgi:hypothetical protein
VPNVTNTIVALAREYVAKRDALIMDAWRNGGQFEGAKATDDMVLAYWKDRYTDLDPSDPTYEDAKNQVMQLEYAVAQSKAGLLHAQGKMTDRAYAQFFLSWAKKVPKNSEFWRSLQKDAATLIENAKAKARANADRLKTEAFNKFVTDTTASHIAIGNAMNDALQALATKTGLTVNGNGEELLSLLTANVAANPDQYRVLLDAIKKDDPTWDGKLTQGYFREQIRDAITGFEMIVDRAQTDGYVSTYAGAAKGMADMSSLGQNLQVWPVAETYQQVMRAMEKVLIDPNSSYMDKQKAAAIASAALTNLAATPDLPTETVAMLTDDAGRLVGEDMGDGPSFGATLGREFVTTELAGAIESWTTAQDEMNANPLAYVYAPVNATGEFDSTGRGPIGIVPAASLPPDASGVMVPGLYGGSVMSMVKPQTVYVTDPNNPSASPRPAGYRVSYNVGGKTVDVWGFKDNTGVVRWTTVSPLSAGTSVTVDNDGNVLVTPKSNTIASDPIARARQIAADPATAALGAQLLAQFEAQQKANSPLAATATYNKPDTKESGGSWKLEYLNGVFTLTETTETWAEIDGKRVLQSTFTTPRIISQYTAESVAFDQSAMSAGDIPGVTFASPLAASVKAANATQTREQVNQYTSDPAFQAQFLAQTMSTLGITDVHDPRIKALWASVATSGDPVERVPNIANTRTDLTYPGASPQRYEGKALGITYGHSELVLPKMPSTSGDPRLRAGAGNILPQPGLPQVLPSASPPPAQFKGDVVPPELFNAPTVTPTSVPRVTPSPTPTSAPTVTAPDYTYKPKGGY